MSLRRAIFFISFILVPSLLWTFRVQPLQERRDEALLQQENSGIQQAANKLSLQERDELQKQWAMFKPMAEHELVSLGNNMNPIVMQNRAIDLARRLECELRIEEKVDRNNSDGPPTFSFSGSGQPLQVYDFLRYLERGDSRARFLDLTVAQRQSSRESGMTAYFSGTFTIPEIPEVDWIKEPQKAESTASSEAATPVVPSAGGAS